MNYNNSEVFLIAISLDEDNPNFRFEFEFSYEEDLGLSGVAIFFIVIFVSLFVVAAALLAVLTLNRFGYISVYIPKKLRKRWLKRFLPLEQQ